MLRFRPDVTMPKLPGELILVPGLSASVRLKRLNPSTRTTSSFRSVMGSSGSARNPLAPDPDRAPYAARGCPRSGLPEPRTQTDSTNYRKWDRRPDRPERRGPGWASDRGCCRPAGRWNCGSPLCSRGGRFAWSRFRSFPSRQKPWKRAQRSGNGGPCRTEAGSRTPLRTIQVAAVAL